MKILILSDNHLKSMREVFKKKYDAIFHCGDYGSYLSELTAVQANYVCGNCDLLGPKQGIAEVFGRKILYLHGNNENVKYDYNQLIYRAMECEARVCFFGHTHRQEVFIEEGILFLNPGSYPFCYAEITENNIYLYHNNIVKTIEYKW